jgi:hypothetical protein
MQLVGNRILVRCFCELLSAITEGQPTFKINTFPQTSRLATKYMLHRVSIAETLDPAPHVDFSKRICRVDFMIYIP